ncbi:hypothetical protein AOLI_G00168010 [Acnodon oligacanthus]
MGGKQITSTTPGQPKHKPVRSVQRFKCGKLGKIPTPNNDPAEEDGSQLFTFSVPHAIIYGLAVLKNLSLQQTEHVFLCGPVYHHSEVEQFNRVIDKQLKKEGRPFHWSH